LALGDNFTNILPAAFMCADPKRAKSTDSFNVFFVLLGSVHVKAVRKMLVKLPPGLKVFVFEKTFQ